MYILKEHRKSIRQNHTLRKIKKKQIYILLACLVWLNSYGHAHKYLNILYLNNISYLINIMLTILYALETNFYCFKRKKYV